MKNLMKSLVLAVAVSAATVSFAQGGGQGRGGMQGMMGGGMSEAMILASPDVQKDLKLTDDQKSKLKALQDAQREEMMAMFQGGGGGDRQAMQTQMQEMMKKSTEKTMAILTADQKVRVKQILLQVGGARILVREDIAKELGITADQKTKMRALSQKAGEANQALMQKVRDQEISREEATAAREKNTKVLDEESMKLLTAEQKTKLAAMQGPKFDGKIEQMGRRGGN